MKLEEQIKNDLKEALKAGDTQTRDVLRVLASDIKNEAIKAQRELEDKDIIAVIKRGIKSRKDSVQQFISGGRADLAEKEESEVAILEKYMPEQMSEQEVEGVVKKVVEKMDPASAKNFGLVMKEVMKEIDDRADGALVSQAVKKTLMG
jgi:uncharacterized protein YqeY